MKNKFILILLLALPVLIYLVFATATHNQLFLPTISRNNKELTKWESFTNEPVSLSKKITILGFTGKNITQINGNIFNLNQKIYDKYAGFKDFQIVMIAPQGTQNDVKLLVEKISGFTENMTAWKFVFAQPQEIQTYFNSFHLKNVRLDSNFGTSEVIIIDKDRNHRGRKGKNKAGKDEYRESYNTISAADLHNEMTDDVKILLREYRLALKRNKNKKDFKYHEKK